MMSQMTHCPESPVVRQEWVDPFNLERPLVHHQHAEMSMLLAVVFSNLVYYNRPHVGIPEAKDHHLR